MTLAAWWVMVYTESAGKGEVTMLTERLRQIIEIAAGLSAEEQDRIALAIQRELIRDEAVRPEVLDLFDEVFEDSSADLDYLRDH